MLKPSAVNLVLYFSTLVFSALYIFLCRKTIENKMKQNSKFAIANQTELKWKNQEINKKPFTTLLYSTL